MISSTQHDLRRIETIKSIPCGVGSETMRSSLSASTRRSGARALSVAYEKPTARECIENA